MSDLIDRQQAIGAVDVYLKRLCNYIGTPKDTELYALERGLLTSVKVDIGELPSAQPTFDARDTQYNLPIGTDLISRAAAIDALRKMQTYKLFSGDDMLLIDQAGAQTELMLLPAAQPERKKGKWIEYEQEFMLEGHTETVQKTVRECSVCTAKIAGMVGIMNFCPHCGAKMEGKQDG